MASRTLTVVTDDLDGTELAEDPDTTVSFSIGSTHYEIDLSAKNRDKFAKALKPYTDAGRVVPARQSGRTTRRGGGSSGKSASVDPAAVRAWAASNGVEVSPRGRIPASVLGQYRAAGN